MWRKGRSGPQLASQDSRVLGYLELQTSSRLRLHPVSSLSMPKDDMSRHSLRVRPRLSNIHGNAVMLYILLPLVSLQPVSAIRFRKEPYILGIIFFLGCTSAVTPMPDRPL